MEVLEYWNPLPYEEGMFSFHSEFSRKARTPQPVSIVKKKKDGQKKQIEMKRYFLGTR
jgi:hypothetical protein